MDIFQPYIDSAYQRFLQWKGSDMCVVFPIITDLHSALDTVDCLNSQKRETLSHILIMNRAAKKFNADFTATDTHCPYPADFIIICIIDKKIKGVGMG